MPRKPLFRIFNAPYIQDSTDSESFYRQGHGDEGTASTEEKSSASPVFLTPQSLASFPGASLAVNLIWHGAAAIHQPLAQVSLVPILGAFLVGAFIFSQSATENMSKNQKISAVFIAFLNSLWLAMMALGINVVNPPD